MSNVHTVASHFGVDSAPSDDDVRLSGKVPQRLVLDILSLEGGASPTIQVTMTELVESTKEIEIVSNDNSAVDTFEAGRVIRGSQSGKHATATGQRTASGTHYLAFADSGPSQLFAGETIEERGLTGSEIAALAVVGSLPTQSHIEGSEIADTTAVSVDTVVDIAKAKRDAPVPNRPRLVRLSYTFTGGPTSASFLVRVSA